MAIRLEQHLGGSRVLSRGAGMQQKNDTLVGQRPVWLSPDRELTVMFPTYMFKALKLAEAELAAKSVSRPASKSLELFYEYAGQLKTFKDSVTGEHRPATLQELESRLNLTSGKYAEAEMVVGKHLHRVILGAYFKGSGYAYMKGDKPITRDDLDAMVADWVGRRDNKKLKSVFYRIARMFGWILGRE